MNYITRLQKLQANLRTQHLSLLFVDSPVNIYYLTGLNLSTGRLCVPSSGNAMLFVDGRYFEQCQANSPVPVALIEKDTIENYLKSLPLASRNVFGFDSGETPYKEYLKLQDLIDRTGVRTSLEPIDSPLSAIRGIKDSQEILTLQEAGKLCSEGFDFACSLLRENITEKEIAIELEIFWKRKKGEKLSFDCIIAFGANSSMPHYRAGVEKLQKNQTVLIDIGVMFNRYHSDMTRTVFFGEPHPQMKEIYQIVKEAQEAALSICRPGILIGDLDKAARNFITNQGYGQAFSHGLGHGVGLEIHEYPSVKDIPPFQNIPLEKGMVITIEPGIYLKGLGGVRIENTIVITDNGYQDLTNRSTDLKIISAQ